MKVAADNRQAERDRRPKTGRRLQKRHGHEKLVQRQHSSLRRCYTWFTDFFFQAMFAATCCTIVSGAVAGRVKLSSFLIFCFLFVSVLAIPSLVLGNGGMDG